MNPAIEAKGLTKWFGELTAVDDLSFTIERTEIFGVVVFSLLNLLIFILILAVLNAVLIKVAAKLFRRETILIVWK